MSADQIEKVKQLIKEYKFPKDPRPDWDGTNHYEIINIYSNIYGHWWLAGPGIFRENIDWSNTEDGKKWGVVLELACSVPHLLDRISDLEKELAEVKDRSIDDHR